MILKILQYELREAEKTEDYIASRQYGELMYMFRTIAENCGWTVERSWDEKEKSWTFSTHS